MKKVVAQFDYDHKLLPQLFDYIYRIDEINKDNDRLARFYSMKDLEWQSHVSELVRSQEFTKAKLDELKRKLVVAKQIFMSIVYEFRTKINSEDFGKVERRVNEWKWEEFISRDEFNRIIKAKKAKLGKSSL